MAKKAPQTQVKKDGTRIRFGTTPGERQYSSSKTKGGRQHTTVTESGPGKTLKVWYKLTDKKNPSRNFKERNVLGSDKYVNVKKGPTTKKV